MFKNISNYNDLNDYFPIFIAAVIIYIIGIIMIYLFIKKKNKKLKEFYKKFNISIIIFDILIIVSSITRARFVFTYFYKEYYLLYFLLTSVCIQIFYDIIFIDSYNLISKNNSLFINILKNKNNKVTILPVIITNIFTNILGILIASFIASTSLNSNINLFISLLVLLPYLVFLLK